MNKKLFLSVIAVFLVIGITIGIASGALLTTFGEITTTIQIKQAIDVDSDDDDSVEVFGGDPGLALGNEIIVTNNADFAVDVEIKEENNPSGIGVEYVAELELTKKTVVFGEDDWEIPSEAEKVTIRYTMVGDEFIAEVIDNAKEGYELIYYKDNSDRFNSPAAAILLDEISGNLPYENDANKEENDYCLTGEYNTCHGAKIWYVPSDAINEDNILDWKRAEEFYYESALIQFNSDGKITIHPLSSVSFRPQISAGYLEEGGYSIKTSVNPVSE